MCDLGVWGRQLLAGGGAPSPSPSPSGGGGGNGTYTEQPFPTGYPSFLPVGMHGRVTSYEADLAGAMPSPAMIQCPGSMPDLITALRVKQSGDGLWVQAVQMVACTSNNTFFRGVNDGGVSTWDVDDTCVSGYNAVRGYERNNTFDFPYGVWGLSFRCSGSSTWSTPIGTGPGGVPGRLVVVECPRSWQLSGLLLWGNASQVGVVAPHCTPPSGIPYDPLGTCPLIGGGTLLPGYVSPNPITADLGVSISANTPAPTLISTCEANANCVAVVTSPTSTGASGDNYNAVLTVGFVRGWCGEGVAATGMHVWGAACGQPTSIKGCCLGFLGCWTLGQRRLSPHADHQYPW